MILDVEDVKKMVKAHNRSSLLFFLILFGLFQFILFYAVKGNILLINRDHLIIVEVTSMALLILSVYVARLNLKRLKPKSSTVQDLIDRHPEIESALRTKERMMHFQKSLSGELNSGLYNDRLLRELLEVFPLVNSAHLLLDEGEGQAKVIAHVGYLSNSFNDYSVRLNETLFFRYCGKHFRRSLILDDQLSGEEGLERQTLKTIHSVPILSMLSCPIHVDGKLVGLINLESSKNNAFKTSDLEWMDFIGNQVSMAVSHRFIIEKGIYLSKFDTLTGLYNRWQLDEFERNTLPHCVRYNEPFLFVSMRLSHLEKINQDHGYHTGDLYLMTFSKLLRSFVRETDLIFRMGGDHFIGIFFTKDVFTMGGKLELMEQSLGKSMKSDLVTETRCSFSYGIVAFPEESQSITDMYQIADERMKQKAKEMESDVRY